MIYERNRYEEIIHGQAHLHRSGPAEGFGADEKDLSEKCGMNRTMISHMENHNYVPSIKQLQDLAEALEFDPTDVLRRSIGLM